MVCKKTKARRPVRVFPAILPKATQREVIFTVKNSDIGPCLWVRVACRADLQRKMERKVEDAMEGGGRKERRNGARNGRRNGRWKED